MLAMINAKRLLNIFSGQNQKVLESIQGFNNVLIGNENLDLLNILNMGINNTLLNKLKTTTEMVEVFKSDLVKEFEDVLRPSFYTNEIAEVIWWVNIEENKRASRQRCSQTERKPSSYSERTKRLNKIERQRISRNEKEYASRDYIPAR